MKLLKKTFALMLSLILVVGMIPGSLMTAYAEGSGDDCYILINNTVIDDLNVPTTGTGWTYTPADTSTDTPPTIELHNYQGKKIHLYDPTPEDGVESYVELQIKVKGDCEIIDPDYGIYLQTDASFSPGNSKGAHSHLYIYFENNASLTINADCGIQNSSFWPKTWIQGSSSGYNANLNITAESYGIIADGTLVIEGSGGDRKELLYGGDIYIDNGIVLDVKAPTPFLNGGASPSKLIVTNGAMVSMTSTTDEDFINAGPYYLYSIPAEYTAYKNAKESELLLYIPAEPEFKDQNPVGNDDESTGLTYTVGDTATFTFDSDTPNGFTVKKTAKLRGLFAGLDEDQTVSNDTDSALTLTHEFENAGLYQLTETLKLYFGSVLVGTKTHDFLISVIATPAPTTYTVDAGVFPNNSGTITGTGTYSAGSSVTLTATPKEGYRFVAWRDLENTTDLSTEPTYTFTVSEDTFVMAKFEKAATPAPTEYNITVTGGTASANKAVAGTSITLTAEQIDGKVFSHWEVNGATVSDANAKETTFTMGNADVTAEAIYDDCDCKCHKGGIVGFFYKIVLFFQKLFGNNLVCNCGKKH